MPNIKETTVADAIALANRIETFGTTNGFNVTRNMGVSPSAGTFADKTSWPWSFIELGSLLRISIAVSGLNSGLVNALNDPPGPDPLTDRELCGALFDSRNLSAADWTDHTDASNTFADADARFLASARMNDQNPSGNYTNVWMFTDSNTTPTYLHVVCQTAAARYSHFSFGLIDKLGMTHPDVAYCTGGFSAYFQAQAGAGIPNPLGIDDNEYGPNNPGESGGTGQQRNRVGFECNTDDINVKIQTSTLDTTFGFTDTTRILTSEGDLVQDRLIRNKGRLMFAEDNITNALDVSQRIEGFPVDIADVMNNKDKTGGRPLIAIPLIYQESNLFTHLGNFPDVRYCSMDGVEPGDEIVVGSDTWTFFPMMQKGNIENMWFNAQRTSAPNTGQLGIAYKKIA